MKITTAIDYSGPFFDGDPAAKLRDNLDKIRQEMARQGEADVKAQLRQGESTRWPLGGGIRPGRVSGHVIGRVRSRTGKPWVVTAVISVNNTGFTKAQGIKLMAATQRLESDHHVFRRTAGRLRRARKVNVAELLKGLE